MSINKYKQFAKVKLDAWISSLSGAGSTVDKSSSYSAVNYTLSPTQAKTLYKSSATAQLIVNLPTEEAARAGFEVKLEDKDESAQLHSRLESLKAPEALQEALRLARLCGGSIVYMATDDSDVSKPLTPKSKVKALRVLGAGEIIATSEYTSSLDSPNFALPAQYSVQTVLPGVNLGMPRVHYSRCIRMSMPVVDVNDLLCRQGFGPSVLEALKPSIRNQETGLDAAGTLLIDMGAGVLTLPGISKAMSEVTETNSDGVDLIRARLRMLDSTRSVHHSTVLDGGDGVRPAETFTRVATPLSGMDQILDRLAQKVSQDSRIPLSILQGVGATGLLNSGSESTQAFRSFVQTIQTSMLRPAIERLVTVLLGDAEPMSWSVSFNPLAVPSQKEIAETNNTQATADCAYVVNGVVTAEEIRKSRFGDKPSLQTTVDSLELPEVTETPEE